MKITAALERLHVTSDENAGGVRLGLSLMPLPERKLPTAAELALEIAALREEVTAIQRASQALTDFGKRAQIEQRISQLRDAFENRLLAHTEALERSNRELTTSYQLLKLIADAISDPIYIKDRNSRFLMSNVALGKALGVPPERLIGNTGAEQLPKEVFDKILADDGRIMGRGTPHQYEETVLLPSGDRRRYFTTKIPFRDNDGTVVGLVGVSRDITSSNDNAPPADSTEP